MHNATVAEIHTALNDDFFWFISMVNSCFATIIILFYLYYIIIIILKGSNMIKKIKIGKKSAALIIAVLVFAVITVLHLLGVFQFLENKSDDMRVRFWAHSIHNRPSDEIIVIIIDQHSIDWAQKERGWGWPWPRQAYAEIVDYMNLCGVKSVAFDFIYSEPSVYDEVIDRMIDEQSILEVLRR